jgi:thymidylate synthase (FAD)
MKLIKPSAEIIKKVYIPNSSNLELLQNIYEQIETAARNCYKSEEKITIGSATKMVEMLINKGHFAMLEHGTVYLTVDVRQKYGDLTTRYRNNKYSVIKEEGTIQKYHITTNYRVLVENNWLDDLQYLCEPTEYHVKRVSVRFICDRGISHELVRHRVFSFAQESTIYCNYSKDKFDNEITFIEPSWETLPQSKEKFKKILDISETIYITLICEGWQTQQARAVLPNALKTELIMTGFIEDWKHFFDLRTKDNSHPQMLELCY